MVSGDKFVGVFYVIFCYFSYNFYLLSNCSTLDTASEIDAFAVTILLMRDRRLVGFSSEGYQTGNRPSVLDGRGAVITSFHT